MEEQLNTIELKEMKKQIALLRSKLEKESIVNEKIIRRSMRDKLKSIKRTSYILCILVLLAVCYFWLDTVTREVFSPWFIGVTIVFLLVAVIYDCCCNRLLRTQNFANGNLLEEVDKLNKYRKMYHRWHQISIPFLFVWLPWFIYEAAESSEHALGLLFGGLVGGCVGGIFGWRWYRKEINTVGEVLEQIEELKKETEI